MQAGAERSWRGLKRWVLASTVVLVAGAVLYSTLWVASLTVFAPGPLAGAEAFELARVSATLQEVAGPVFEVCFGVAAIGAAVALYRFVKEVPSVPFARLLAALGATVAALLVCAAAFIAADADAWVIYLAPSAECALLAAVAYGIALAANGVKRARERRVDAVEGPAVEG